MSIELLDIRRAQLADAARIAQVHDASWRHAYNGMLPHKALDRMVRRRGEHWWQAALKRSTLILVAQVDDQIVGYATLGPNRVDSLKPDGEIYEIYLKPEYQGVGLGTGLFLSARKELKRRNLIGTIVWVLAENDLAISFYENAGGIKIAEGHEQFDGTKVLKIAYGWN